MEKSEAQSSSVVDLNTVPYDASLAFQEPSKKWIATQMDKGRKGNTLTNASVPGSDLSGKWILISGSNNGIGREAAIQFAAWGANLVLACRNPPPHETHPEVVVEECKESARKAGHEKITVEWWELDMGDLASVETLAKRWLESGRALDILCNNAGLGSTPLPMPFISKDGFELTHQVNFLSHVLLTLHLLPSIAKATSPRIVCTTSCFHYGGKFDMNNWNGEKDVPGNQAAQYYMNNKLLFQIWLTELQCRLLQHEQYKHITINGVHPGYVASGIWNLANNAPITQFILKTLAWFMGISTQQGSLAITNAATSLDGGPNPETQGVGVKGGLGGGRYFNRIWEEEPMPHTKDRDCRLRVWRKVNEELKLEEKGLLDVLGLRSQD